LSEKSNHGEGLIERRAIRLELAPYAPVADAIALLFHPHVEVVLHDLTSDRIAHIAGSFSRRAVGDESLSEIADLKPLQTDFIGPYAKTNWDGHQLRSISIVLRGRNAKAVGLLCINADLSAFEAAHAALGALLAQGPGERRAVDALFPKDWREAVNAHVAAFASARGTAVRSLSAEEQAELVEFLDRQGLLAMRGAPQHLMRIFDCSRATLYKRLRASRKPGGTS
jgi:D-arginine utilization repressor